MAGKKDAIRFCIQKGSNIYRAVSLYLLPDGSFKIDVPRCKHTEGLILTVPHADQFRDSRGEALIPLTVTKQAFKLKNRPQLSMHSSGFVQFSLTNKIKSGVDEKTGSSKGAAIYSKPFDTPISTGPTCGAMMWGLEQGYELADTTQKNLTIFRESDFTQLRSGWFDVSNTFLLDFWVIKPASLPGTARHIDNPNLLTFKFAFYKAVLTMRVFPLQRDGLALGVIPILMDSGFAKKTPFGFYLSSPMGFLKRDDIPNYQTMYSLHAFSPPPAFNGYFEKENLPSLDLDNGDRHS